MSAFNPDLSAVIAESGLSAQELAIIPSWQLGAVPCILDADAKLVFEGKEIVCGLSVYGRPVRGFRGDREQPSEPSGYDITAVVLNAGGIEQDITCALGADELATIEEAIKEG